MPTIYYQKPNKWHKPVTLVEVDTMIKFKTPVKNKLNISIVLDRSSSMMPLKKAAVDSLNHQLNSFRAEALRTGVETVVSIVTFSTTVDPIGIHRVPIETTGEIDANSYYPSGHTALYDAIKVALSPTVAPTDSNNMGLVLIITDGEENQSLTSQAAIRDLIGNSLRSGRMTLAMCVPPKTKGIIAERLQVPIGCITEWEATEAGFKTVSNSVSFANTQIFDTYSCGLTRSANYFQPQLDNLTPKVVKSNLDDVTNNYKILPVQTQDPQDLVISNFVTKYSGKSYSPGKAYYELTKKEDVQNYKNILLLDKASKKVYTGDGIRGLLGIPEGGTIELNPSFNPNYTVFVKSMSWNRKLANGTNVLVKS
jgi:hypothetical protein